MKRSLQGLWLVLWMAWCASVAASAQSTTYSRIFWTPQYHKLPLSYCLIDGKTCGKVVATAYCRAMGYDRADHVLIAYELGETRFFQTNVRCHDWRCDGFKKIRCIGHLPTHPRHVYVYRKQHFFHPRYQGVRVDWCGLGDGKQCGRPAAFSFCRRLGYTRTIGYQSEAPVGATCAILNQHRCFGAMCKGFRYIDCYR